MLVVTPLSSKAEFSRVETRSKFPLISLFNIEHMQMRHGTGQKQVRGVVQAPSRGFMTRFFSQNEANQSHDNMRCLVSYLHYSELLLRRIVDKWIV